MIFQHIKTSKRSNKQWHDCGEKPRVPENGRDVACAGAYCAAVCPQGYRSQGRWRVKCQANNTWSAAKFSPCITCPSLSPHTADINTKTQTIFSKNLPVTQFFCGDNTDQLVMNGRLFKKGTQKRNVKCMCKNGQNGDPAWKKSCSWSFLDAPWHEKDSELVMCYDQKAVLEYDVDPTYSCENSDDHRRHPQTPGSQNALLSCKDGFVIRVDSAIYGKPEGSTMCIDKKTDHKKCSSEADHTAHIKRKCDGEATCSYHGKNHVAGDPCRGVAKHTVINYTCVQPTFSYSNQAYSCEASNQGPTEAKLRCSPGKKINVRFAKYGRQNKETCPSKKDRICQGTTDHTKAAAEKCNGKELCEYHGTNNLGDPCRGSQKYTHIHYTCE